MGVLPLPRASVRPPLFIIAIDGLATGPRVGVRHRRKPMRSVSNGTKAALALALLLALPAVARAQATGTISGVVTDPTGAVLPGATVDAKNEGTGQLRTATTSAECFYTLPPLPPRQYEGKRALSGF